MPTFSVNFKAYQLLDKQLFSVPLKGCQEGGGRIWGPSQKYFVYEELIQAIWALLSEPIFKVNLYDINY